MTRTALLGAIDSPRIEEAILARLGMTATRHRNGILFFIVPARRRFVVLGDEGIHAKVGQEFWERLAAAVSEHLRDGDFTLALVHGIEMVGEQLGLHFPFDPTTDANELPDQIDFGRKPSQG